MIISTGDKVSDISLKNQMRLKTLDKRDRMQLSLRESLSCEIFASLSELNEYMEADTLLFYVDYRSEVMTRPYIKKALSEGKKVYCPRVEGLDISFFRIDDMTDLKPGYQGILEPAPDALRRYTANMQNNTTMVIVPGSVFDRSGNRMGYGKGFYDRFLKRYDKLIKTAVCFDMQIMDEEIPHDHNDVKMDLIVSERQVLRING